MTAPVQIAKLQADVALITADSAGVQLLALPDLASQVNALTPDPLPTPGAKDVITIYDGPQDLIGSPPAGITKNFLYKGWLPWANVGGDWVDAAGTPQGTVPFFTMDPKTGQVGVIKADVTELCKVDARLLLRGVGTETASFVARGAGQEGPTIVYDTPSGPVTVACIADDECNPSTEYELGDRPTFSVTSANGVYIAFPEPPVGWTKATLQLTIAREYTGGSINGFRFAWGGLPPMQNPGDTLSLEGDPRVFFETADFTDLPGYLKAQIFGDKTHSLAPDLYNQRNLVKDENGKTVLQLTFDPRVNACLAAAILFPNGDEADEAAVECEIRFMPDMLTGLRQGFKCFAGFGSATRPDDAYFAKIWGTQVGRCGTQASGNGGARDQTGTKGWSTRFDMMMSPPSDHPMYGHFAPMQYVYWPEQKDFFGDAFLWNGAGFTPRVNEWHRFTTRLKVNSCVGTTFQKDAELDCFVDGILAQRRRGFYLRCTDDPVIMHAPWNVQEKVTYDVRSKLKIARAWLNGYHGGTYLPRSRCSYQIRNLRVAKFA